MPGTCSRRIPTLTLLVLLMGASAPACKLFKSKKATKEAVAFNEALVAHNKSVNKMARELGVKIGQRLAGKDDVDDADLEDGVEAIQAKIKQVRAAVKAMKVPDHPTARALHKAYLTFLDEESRLIGRLEDVVEVVTTPDPRKRRQRRRLLEILREIQSAEKKSLTKLRKVQHRFARAHNIGLRM